MNRRQFLQTTGAASAGLAVAPAAARGPAPEALSSGTHWLWMRGEHSDAVWRETLGQAREAGVTGALIDTPLDAFPRVIEIAGALGVAVHAWMITMMEGGQEEAHPEWYAVNREGASTATDPPYVPYYRFMCPSREPVKRHKVERARRLLALPNLAGLHLDYIRYPDVILPRALWPVYDIVQDREYAPYDYCYCEVCRATFRDRTGIEPLDLEDPSQNRAWVQYRWDTIVEMVNALGQATRAAERSLSAAVFPSPSIARALVRQDWPRWPLDAAFPMVYQGFYEEDIPWIGATVAEGVAALGGRFPLYAGLYLPDLQPPADLARAARTALQGGASGVALFDGPALTPAHWAALRPVLRP